MMNTNFEKFTKRTRQEAQLVSYQEQYGKGRKLNKTKRDRSHKRNWEGR